MSLLLLSTAVSGVKAMEPIEGAAPVAEVVDKYASLQPRLSNVEVAQHQGTIAWLPTEATRAQLLEACNASIVLETDENPLARTKSKIADRKALWARYSATAAADKVDANLEADYLSGTEDEVETTDEVIRLNQIVARVHRRDRHIQAQTTTQKTRDAAKATLKAKEEALSTQHAALLTVKGPLDEQAIKLAQDEADLQAQEAQFAEQEAALNRCVDTTMKYVKLHEQTLADVTREELVPNYASKLIGKKATLATQLGVLAVAKQAHEQKLNPVIAQLKEVETAQQETKAKQAELEQLLEKAKNAQILAQTDREKLLLALDQSIELAVAQRETFKKDVANLTTEISTEKDAETKITLLESKKTTEAQLAQVIQSISNLRTARAQADMTYGTAKWLAGYYSGAK